LFKYPRRTFNIIVIDIQMGDQADIVTAKAISFDAMAMQPR
jgi:hypothetical protein